MTSPTRAIVRPSLVTGEGVLVSGPGGRGAPAWPLAPRGRVDRPVASSGDR
jgi:hypothetical protein